MATHTISPGVRTRVLAPPARPSSSNRTHVQHHRRGHGWRATAGKALEAALEMAQRYGARVVVISAYTPLPDWQLVPERTSLLLEFQWASHIKEEVDAILADALRRARDSGLDGEVAAAEGEPADVICQLAAEHRGRPPGDWQQGHRPQGVWKRAQERLRAGSLHDRPAPAEDGASRVVIGDTPCSSELLSCARALSELPSETSGCRSPHTRRCSPGRPPAPAFRGCPMRAD
jgi:hypothetical protein